MHRQTDAMAMKTFWLYHVGKHAPVRQEPLELQKDLRPLILFSNCKINMTMSTINSTNRIARRAGKQGARLSMEYEVEIDKHATGSKLLKCKRNVNFSTMNVWTLNGESKFGESTHISERYGIDVTCIQEHKLYHPGENMKYHNMGNGWTLATSSAEKACNNATIRGIGMFLSPMAYRSLLNVESISSRIMIVTFNGNPKVTVVSCYSPTNCSEEEEAQEFYDQLTELIKQVPKHNVMLIDGDMNAKIGTEDCKGDILHINNNRNGEFMLNLITECALVNLGTNYCKLKGQLWTFTCPAGAKD